MPASSDYLQDLVSTVPDYIKDPVVSNLIDKGLKLFTQPTAFATDVIMGILKGWGMFGVELSKVEISTFSTAIKNAAAEGGNIQFIQHLADEVLEGNMNINQATWYVNLLGEKAKEYRIIKDLVNKAINAVKMGKDIPFKSEDIGSLTYQKVLDHPDYKAAMQQRLIEIGKAKKKGLWDIDSGEAKAAEILAKKKAAGLIPTTLKKEEEAEKFFFTDLLEKIITFIRSWFPGG